MYILYGIKNCDKVRAARKWLDAEEITFKFEDIRDNPVNHSDWSNWIGRLGVDLLINRRSTTWKQLPEDDKQDSSNFNALKLLEKYPTLMKRPLLTSNGKPTLVGFSSKQYSEHFNR